MMFTSLKKIKSRMNTVIHPKTELDGEIGEYLRTNRLMLDQAERRLNIQLAKVAGLSIIPKASVTDMPTISEDPFDLEDGPAQEYDDVNHPTHYRSDVHCPNCEEKIDCIDVIEKMQDIRLATAMKYIWRVGLGGGKGDDGKDIAKALWYLARWLKKNSQQRLFIFFKELEKYYTHEYLVRGEK